MRDQHDECNSARCDCVSGAHTERNVSKMTDQNPVTRDELTLIARDVHLYDGGPNQALTGLGAQRIADAILARFVVLRKTEEPKLDPKPWRCGRCGSRRWIGWAAGPGLPRKAQCVPCGWVGDLQPEPEHLASDSIEQEGMR